MKYNSVLLILLILFTERLCAQPEANHWYFGNNAGLDFSTGTAIAVNNGALETNEGCASVSDASGNLLFYTDGVTVYDRLHQPMPNGNNLYGHYSSTQSVLIVQKPGTTDHYYIFTTDAGDYVDPPNNGLHFSEVDMNLSSGNGDVIASTKNTLLLATATEKLCGTLHANGTDVWVMAHGWNDSTFYAFSVTASGVNMIPVTSSTGSLHGGSNDNSIGQMKFSPQGDKLALAVRISGFFELFDFNNTTGIVSNPLHLQIPQFLTAYGLEFSPSGNRLYVCTDSFLTLYQYDLSSGIPSVILNSQVAIGTANASLAGSMQLAPDGKIYVALSSGTSGNLYLSRINNPEASGTSCNFTNNAVNLGTGRSYLGLPNFVSSYFLPTGIQTNIYSDFFSAYYDHWNNSIKIKLPDNSHPYFIASLYTISGKEILTELIQTKITEIDLPVIKPGIYLLLLKNRDFIASKKIFVE